MRDRVAVQAVGAALEDDEFGLVAFQVRDHRLPRQRECRVVRARRQRNIELGSLRQAGAGLF